MRFSEDSEKTQWRRVSVKTFLFKTNLVSAVTMIRVISTYAGVGIYTMVKD